MTPALRPLRIGEILDVAIKLYLRNARTLLPLVLVVAGPLHLLGTLITLSTRPQDAQVTFEDVSGGTPTATPADTVDVSGTFLTGQILVVLLGLLVTTLATAVSFKALSDAYLGERPQIKPSLRFVARRVHSVLWVTLLTYLGVIVGLVALAVPGIWLGVAWAVAVPALMFEGVRGRKALGRSFRLVRKRWWPSLAAIAVGYILASIVGMILQAAVIAPAFGTSDSDAVAIVANGVASIVAAIAVTPFQAAVVAVLYYDLRVRKEGFDLELLAERLGLPVPAGGAATFLPPAGAAPGGDGERPPFWPPPPGWRPREVREE